MTLENMLRKGMELGASDIFVVPGAPASVKLNGSVVPIDEQKLSPSESWSLISAVYEIDGRDVSGLVSIGDDDFSFSVPHCGRFRCNAFKQRSSYAMVLRIVSFDLPNPSLLNIPDSVMNLCKTRKGLVLVTGPAASGKSTTLACMIDRINETYQDHIITIEDPIEFIQRHKKSIVTQREIACDTESYSSALRAALRQAPNVIFLGEMRDFETIKIALTAAETGQLVLSTLHTVGAAKTIDRIIDVFPPSQQQQIRVQLSMVLRAVVSQQLVPAIGGGLVPSFEIMIVNSAIQNMIREGKVYQIDNVIQSGAAQGMRAMDDDLLALYRDQKIGEYDALLYASNQELLQKRIKMLK